MAAKIVSKQQLAEALGYSTDYFFRLVHANSNVMTELSKSGYSRRSRNLSPKQLDIICDYYGYPEGYDRD